MNWLKSAHSRMNAAGGPADKQSLFEERRERLDREAAKTRERRRKRAERELKEKMRLHLETEKCVSKSSSTQDINIDKDNNNPAEILFAK